MDTDPEPPAFEATIWPHRSLSRRALIRIVCALLAVSALVSTLMALVGAWPVIGFNGGEMILAVVLLWINARAARAREIITLGGNALRVTRISAGGRASAFELPAYFLSVRLQERAGRVPRLCLAQRGREIEVAHALGDSEKRDLAAALETALERWRNPRFVNPQLAS